MKSLNEKESNSRPNWRGKNWENWIGVVSFEYREKGREGFARDLGKKTFCHGNKVKPWKFERKITKFIVRLTGGRKKGRKKHNKQTNKQGKIKKERETA